MNNVIDLSAKLLANEDVSVRRAKTKTASFDIKSRVLTLPMWQEMTAPIEQMLVGHEVGHALYTTDEYSSTIDENRSLKSYLNVLEDVRIEKLIKKKYPGIRKHMAAGYKELNDRDFFGIEGKDVNSMLLIDKINLYFKASLFNLEFTPVEKQFVVRAERTESIQDVIDLAKEVYEYSKEEYEKMMEEMENDPDFQEDDDAEGDDEFEGDYDGWDNVEDDDDELDEDGNTNSYDTGGDADDAEDLADVYTRGAEGNGNATPDTLESQTQKAFDNNLEDLADIDTEYRYFKFKDAAENVKIPFRRVLKELAEDLNVKEESYSHYQDQSHMTSRDREFQSFKDESNKTVNYLVKEFEMRKSASLYKRAQTAKSGSLDMKKIWGYQLNDDLFKRVTVLPEGKNHGMMILVDWSGSMHNVITDTIKQVINLAMFCQRTQIPYRVYAFSNHYRDHEERALRNAMTAEEREAMWEKERAERDAVWQDEQPWILLDNFNMFELFSNKMTSSEFWNMAKMLLHPYITYCNRYGLGATPLNEALIWVYQNMGKFIKGNNIEKMTFITLTDGEGADMNTNKTLRERTVKEHGSYNRETDTHTETTYNNYRNLITDPDTKKTYRIKPDSNQQTRMMIKMIKDRYNCRTVGFYITTSARRDLYWAIRSNSKTEGMMIDSQIQEMRRNFRTDGFHSLAGSGRDELFVIPQAKMKIDEDGLQANGEMTARKLASQFGKYLNKKKTSRVLLNKFIGWVA